jgi:threonine/homoserine/homoserine lactone efflux protein
MAPRAALGARTVRGARSWKADCTVVIDLSFPARGLVIGFTVAMVVGPIGLLTIRRTLAHGRVYGLASGLGVALADASYGGVAAFGLTAVTAILVGARSALALVGGAFLVWLAVRTLRAAAPTREATDTQRPGLAAAAASIYALTMTNPMTILSFAAIFAGLGLGGGNTGDAALLTAGVFLGSAAWWLLLTSVVAAVRGRVTPTVLLGLNRLSGLLILAFGVRAIATGLGIA